jgi:hypothetical protein
MRVAGECTVCGGQNGNHAGWCGHARRLLRLAADRCPVCHHLLTCCVCR